MAVLNHHNYQPEKTSVCVIGLGYIGLPTASVLAAKGFNVLGVDIRSDIVDKINDGKIHLREPDLDILVRSAVGSGQLRASVNPEQANVFIICVPTPLTDENKPDLSFVESACQAIRPHVREGNLVILESTSPPGTTSNLVVKQALPEGLVPGENVYVAHCPERVLPGHILLEVVQNDRVVGGSTSACSEQARIFYSQFVNGEVLTTSAVVAELTKLVENAFRDVNIALANEISLIADLYDANPWEVIELANHHPRVDILSPGPGVGGHCIGVDPWFLAHGAPHSSRLLQIARMVNDGKPAQVVSKIKQLAEQFCNPTIGCLGLTYKANVDDLRQSPSLEIVRQLHKLHLGQILVCDPLVHNREFDEFDEFSLDSLEYVTQASDILVLLTDHREFNNIPNKLLAEKVLVDTRGAWR